MKLAWIKYLSLFSLNSMISYERNVRYSTPKKFHTSWWCKSTEIYSIVYSLWGWLTTVCVRVRGVGWVQGCLKFWYILLPVPPPSSWLSFYCELLHHAAKFCPISPRSRHLNFGIPTSSPFPFSRIFPTLFSPRFQLPLHIHKAVTVIWLNYKYAQQKYKFINKFSANLPSIWSVVNVCIDCCSCFRCGLTLLA